VAVDSNDPYRRWQAAASPVRQNGVASAAATTQGINTAPSDTRRFHLKGGDIGVGSTHSRVFPVRLPSEDGEVVDLVNIQEAL
jgi:hypothetical protein